MLKIRKLYGLSLVEVMVSVVIFAITLPIIYKTLFNTQSYLAGIDAEVKLELEANTALQYIIKDIKEATVIYDRKTKDISLFKDKFLTDAVNGTEFTDNQGAEGSAILLMKFASGKILPVEAGNKKVGQYELIAYYMRILPRDDVFYDSLVKMRSIVRLVSEQSFIDPTPLNLKEREWVVANGYLLWTPPKKGFSYPLPSPDLLSVRKIKLTVNTSPDGFKVIPKGSPVGTGTIVPPPGGLVFTQNDNNISITLYSLRRTVDGIKSFSFKSYATANSLIY
jgi:hypothetical protein